MCKRQIRGETAITEGPESADQQDQEQDQEGQSWTLPEKTEFREHIGQGPALTPFRPRKVIKNEPDYEAALPRIDELMDAGLDTAEGDELELLVTLVELYEKKTYPIDLPDPVAAIKFRMDQMGLKQKDLIPFIGSRSKVSEV